MFVFLLMGAALGAVFALVFAGLLLPIFGVGIGALGPLGALAGWAAGLAPAVLATLGGGSLLALGLLIWFAAVGIAYAFGALSLIGATAPTPAPGGATSVGPTVVDSLARGFFVGSTAVANLATLVVLGSLWGLPVLIGFVVGAVGLLCVIPPLTRWAPFKAILGWLSWVMPMSWLATALGLLVFLINVVGAPGLRLDVTTGTIETTGGFFVMWLASLTGSTGGGWNLGSFSFLAGPVGSGIRTPFGSPGISAHESGHALAVAAYGSFFHYVDAVDENVPPLSRGARAYGELVAESHFPGSGRYYLPVWSA